MKRYIVTGGLGHIGSHLADALIERGDEVLIIDDGSTGSLEYKHPLAELLTISAYDVLEREEVLSESWDGVFHLAAFVSVREGNEQPMLAESRGSNLTVAMLELCRRLKIPKMVFVSSVVVASNPHIPYGIEKDASERYCRYYEKQFGLDVSIIRLHNVYGSPRHTVATGNVIPALLDQKRQTGRIKISGNGLQMRDFVYYTDVVRAITEAEQRIGTTEIGTCVGHSMIEVAKYFDCPIDFVGRHSQDIDRQVCEKSDYETRVSLEQGMGKLFGHDMK